MTYNNLTRHPVNRKLLARIFSRIIISRTLFYKGVSCWEWQGGRMKGGYATTSYIHPERGKQICNYGVHRLMHELFISIIPADQEVDHLCRVRHCVNPVHLESVTQQVNILRGISFSAVNAAKTHCFQGHPLSGDNLLMKTGYRGKPMRECKICQQRRNRVNAQKWRDTRKANGLPTRLPKKSSHKAKSLEFKARALTIRTI